MKEIDVNCVFVCVSGLINVMSWSLKVFQWYAGWFFSCCCSWWWWSSIT